MPIQIPTSVGTKTEDDFNPLNTTQRAQIIGRKTRDTSTRTTRTVKQGETINDIAEEVTGDSARLEEILSINPQIPTSIADDVVVADILPGQVLNIPSSAELAVNVPELSREVSETIMGFESDPSREDLMVANKQFEGRPALSENEAQKISDFLGANDQPASNLPGDVLPREARIIGDQQTGPLPYETKVAGNVWEQLTQGDLPPWISERTQLLLGLPDEFLEAGNYIFDSKTNRWILPIDDGSGGRGSGSGSGFGGGFGGGGRSFGGGTSFFPSFSRFGRGGTPFPGRSQLMTWRISF